MSQASGVTPLTICQVVHGLPVGGAEVMVDQLVRRLRGQHRVVVACLDAPGELGEALCSDGVEICELHRRPGFDWKCVRRLAELIRAVGADVVHAHQYTPFAYAAAGSRFRPRPPILFTEHGRFYPDVVSSKRRWFNQLMIRPGDRFAAVGESVRRALIDNEGFPAKRIEIVYNGVRFDEAAHASPRDAVRRELGLADDDFAVMQVARLDPIKDHATAVRAFVEASRAAPSLRLLLVGDGPERAAVQAQIAAADVGSKVRLLGTRRDVPRLLAAADAFLLTSLSEGTPVTIIEAMGAGVPVVATTVGGVPEVVEDGRSGLLAPAGDAASLAVQLVRLAGDAELRARLATAARLRARAEFGEATMFARYEALLMEMASRRRG